MRSHRLHATQFACKNTRGKKTVSDNEHIRSYRSVRRWFPHSGSEHTSIMSIWQFGKTPNTPHTRIFLSEKRVRRCEPHLPSIVIFNLQRTETIARWRTQWESRAYGVHISPAPVHSALDRTTFFCFFFFFFFLVFLLAVIFSFVLLNFCRWCCKFHSVLLYWQCRIFNFTLTRI